MIVLLIVGFNERCLWGVCHNVTHLTICQSILLTLNKSTSYIQHKTRKIGHKVYSTLYYPILLTQCTKLLNTLLTSLILLSGRDVNRVHFISLYTLTELNPITYNIMCNISWSYTKSILMLTHITFTHKNY